MLKWPGFGRGGGAARAGAPPAPVDPLNKDSELTPAEVGQEPVPQGVDAQAVVELMVRRAEDAAAARRPLERRWALAAAFEDGNQWVDVNPRTSRLESLMEEDERNRYVTVNQIKPLLLKVAARATLTKPDASTAPLTMAVKDRLAAREGRSIVAHLDRLHNSQEQTRRMAMWALRTTTCYLKQYWDPSRVALVPVPGPDGTVAAASSAKVGEVCETIVPGHEVFLDPGAQDAESVRWLIHEVARPLDYVKTRWGKLVEPDIGAHTSFIEAIATGTPARTSKMARVRECWELPTERYPSGRLMVTAGDQLVYYREALPYYRPDRQGLWSIPFTPLGWQEGLLTPYDRGLAEDLVQPQRTYNRILSRILERMEGDKTFILYEGGTGMAADAFESTRNWEKIPFRAGGMPPTMAAPPPMNPEWFGMLNLMKGVMQDLSGVHDISQGKVPAGVTAGNAIELLQQSDTTQMAGFLARIEAMTVARAEWRILLYAQFAREPRLMGLDDTGNPQEALAAAQSFRALSSGGQTRVVVVPGSATPKTPGAKNEQVMSWYRLGLFGPPNDPRAASIAIELMDMSRSDEVLQRLQTLTQQLQEEAARNSPAAAQQAQMAARLQSEQARQQQAAQGEQQKAQLEQAKLAAQLETERLKARTAELEAQVRLQIEAAKASAELEIERIRAFGAPGADGVSGGGGASGAFGDASGAAGDAAAASGAAPGAAGVLAREMREAHLEAELTRALETYRREIERLAAEHERALRGVETGE